MKILITGAAGFIGHHLIRKIKESGSDHKIVAIDNFNSYYSTKLKWDRCKLLSDMFGLQVINMDITDSIKLEEIVDKDTDIIVHLAAQAGVRYSIENPRAYVESNILGFTNILELARERNISHCIYASSSSVYGDESSVPFSEDNPLHSFESLYAVTKATNEMMASVYTKHYEMNLTGLRFFTVYGSWGRPDMAYFSFADAIMEGRTIKIYNNGNMKRDFTHVSDITEGILRIIDKGPKENPAGTSQIYNIGRGNPVELMKFIGLLEKELGQSTEYVYVPMQPGDVHTTWADVSNLKKDYGYEPKTDLEDGIREFIDWYKGYFSV